MNKLATIIFYVVLGRLRNGDVLQFSSSGTVSLPITFMPVMPQCVIGCFVPTCDIIKY